MAAAAGKSRSLSLFMETYGLEVEEELSAVAVQYWAEGVWTRKWSHEQKEAWMRQIREVQTWKQVSGPAGAVMCETRDLGTQWPHWHTLVFEGEVRVDMRYVGPEDVKKMLLQRARTAHWKDGQQSMNMKNSRRVFGWTRRWPCCERRQREIGLKSIETWKENCFWKEAGCRKDSSTLVGK